MICAPLFWEGFVLIRQQALHDFMTKKSIKMKIRPCIWEKTSKKKKKNKEKET